MAQRYFNNWFHFVVVMLNATPVTGIKCQKKWGLSPPSLKFI
tara:strand:+ start:555 stop:680 length:126 start_codon:yes stop_codon:yes gene_type:complete